MDLGARCESFVICRIVDMHDTCAENVVCEHGNGLPKSVCLAVDCDNAGIGVLVSQYDICELIETYFVMAVAPVVQIEWDGKAVFGLSCPGAGMKGRCRSIRAAKNLQ